MLLENLKTDAADFDTFLQNFHKIRLLINKTSYQITKVEVYNYNSSRNECTISQYKTNAKATDADFSYDAAKYKGYEVVDMR